MPDITMCIRTTCPDREQCYRYKATASHWQSYSVFEGTNDKNKCEAFVENRYKEIEHPQIVDTI